MMNSFVRVPLQYYYLLLPDVCQDYKSVVHYRNLSIKSLAADNKGSIVVENGGA